MSNTDFEPEDNLAIDEPDAAGDDLEGVEEFGEEELLADDDDGLDEEMSDEPRRDARAERDDTLRREAEAARISAAEERVRREGYERQLAEIRTREDPALEAERLALMTPEERGDYKLNRALAQQDANNRRAAFQMQDRLDKAAFDNKAATDPTYARFADKVEVQLAELSRQGQWVERERLLKYLVGEHVLAARDRGDAGVTRRSPNVDRSRTTPVRGRTDTNAPRQRVADTPAKRLEGVQI